MSQLSQVLPLMPSKLFRFWLPLLVILSAGGVLILMVFTTLIFQVVYLDRVYPGVSVLGVDVGGMSQNELITAIERQSPAYLARSITIEAGEQNWMFSGQELGMQVNAAIIADEVFAVGRQGDFFSDMTTHLRLLINPREIDPLLWYDTGPADRVLQQLATEINRPPKDAELIIQPDGQVEIIPAQRGRQLHLASTRAALDAVLFDETGERVMAVVQEILPAIPDVALARRQAENLLSAPLVFRVNNTDIEGVTEWQLKPQTVASLIKVIERVDENGQTQVRVEPITEKFVPHFDDFAQAIYQAPRDAMLDFNEVTNEVVVLQESQNGYALDIVAALGQVSALTEKADRVIDLPLIVTPPAISSEDIASLGIKEVVSESTSYFKGSSQGRMHNIALSASKFQNVVIPPGHIFSFNEHLGEVTKEAGFDESLIIFGDRTTVGIGGGVCQVSTTVFRAAFFGGFEIVERWAHGYRVGWYETNSAPGLDATIYTPSVDFKFRNDTGHHILIKTYSDLEAGTTTFRFYGTSTNREVIVSEPVQSNPIKPEPPVYEEDSSLPKGQVKQVDWANDGLDVTVTRVVKDGDTVIHQDEIVSHYRPWQAVYKVGTGGS